MPDGDILRHGIPGEYSNAYAQICDDVAPADCAKTMARSLRKLIEKYGPGPRELLKTFACEAEQIANQFDTIPVNHLCTLDALIERERRNCTGHRDGLNIASDTCKTILYSLHRQNKIVDTEFELASRYVRQVLERTFDARIDGIKDPKLGEVPVKLFRQRRQEIQPHLEKYLDHFASQIVRFASNKRLSLPRTSRRKTGIDLDDIVE